MARWHAPRSTDGNGAPAQGSVFDLSGWTPTREAALAQLRRVDPRAYGRTRNSLDGAVTRLSPWITHGFIGLPEIVDSLRARFRVNTDDKLVFELAWREFFHHVWGHQGEDILRDIRAPLAGVEYAATLPDDILTASTGVPVIDATVRQLYATGYLHNHQRMWLASYVVHLRKVAWRAAADWLYGHLLDGDLASNHLSWQWCAGTFSSKPYLFNADNVARYAPALASPGTAIDAAYPALDELARHGRDVGPESQRPEGMVPPSLAASPPPGPFAAIDALRVNGRRVALVHPWCLTRPRQVDLVIGVLHAPFHERFPWSALRWRFVNDGMRQVTDGVWHGDLAALPAALESAASVQSVATLNPGYREALDDDRIEIEPAPRFLADPEQPCRSFSQFWEQVARAT